MERQVIPAIETVYKGYRFRSRLEARWAVFFDELAIDWRYEAEGYEIRVNGKTRRYLPDFYLPKFGVWVEVKGDENRLDVPLLAFAAHPETGLPASPAGDSVIRKPGTSDPEACWPWTKRRMLILGPIPEHDDALPIRFHALLAARPVRDSWAVELDYAAFTPAYGSGLLTYSLPTNVLLTPELALTSEAGEVRKAPALLVGPYLVYGVPANLSAAYSAARQSRFEHGESGAPR